MAASQTLTKKPLAAAADDQWKTAKSPARIPVNKPVASSTNGELKAVKSTVHATSTVASANGPVRATGGTVVSTGRNHSTTRPANGWSTIAAAAPPSIPRMGIQQPCQPSPTPPLSSSTDWRNHPMSPRQAQADFPAPMSEGQTWPSLGGLTKSKESSAPKLPPVKGAWAAPRR
jgi:hypothetical protein